MNENNDADKIVEDLMKHMKTEVFGMVADMYSSFRVKGIPANEAGMLTMQFIRFMVNESKEGKK